MNCPPPRPRPQPLADQRLRLHVNTADGITHQFSIPSDLPLWSARQADRTFQSTIRGAGIHLGDVQYLLPVPTKFQGVAYSLEHDGSALRLSYQADDVLARITLYYKANPVMARFDVCRIGRPRWVPPGRTMPTSGVRR